MLTTTLRALISMTLYIYLLPPLQITIWRLKIKQPGQKFMSIS